MLILGAVVIVFSVGISIMMFWAGAMSDNPIAGQQTANQASWVFCIGIVIGLAIASAHWWLH